MLNQSVQQDQVPRLHSPPQVVPYSNRNGSLNTGSLWDLHVTPVTLYHWLWIHSARTSCGTVAHLLPAHHEMLVLLTPLVLATSPALPLSSPSAAVAAHLGTLPSQPPQPSHCTSLRERQEKRMGLRELLFQGEQVGPQELGKTSSHPHPHLRRVGDPMCQDGPHTQGRGLTSNFQTRPHCSWEAGSQILSGL